MPSSRFEQYLRFGLTAHNGSAEAKFNPYHDNLGRFTDATGSTGSSNRQLSQAPRGMPVQPSSNQAPRQIDNHRRPLTRPAAEISSFPQDGPRAWRTANDYAFEAAANFYNKKYGLRLGDIDYKTPHFLKAWAMRESGGEGNRAAFQTDPFQVNNPGDWVPEKTKIAGIRRGQK